MNPFASVLARWVEAFANGSAQLDPLTRRRLRALTGRSIAIELAPSGETTTLQFDGDAVRLTADRVEAPSVIVRGSPAALAAAFVSTSTRGGITIEGDEVVLGEFRRIVADYRPDVLQPLEELVGTQAAQTITSVLELGLSVLGSLSRSVGDESRRLARDRASERYLTAAEFEPFLQSIQGLRVRLDRLNVRTGLVERARAGTGDE